MSPTNFTVSITLLAVSHGLDAANKVSFINSFPQPSTSNPLKNAPAFPPKLKLSSLPLVNPVIASPKSDLILAGFANSLFL